MRFMLIAALLSACSPDKAGSGIDGTVSGNDTDGGTETSDDTGTGDDTASEPLDDDGDGYTPEAGDCDDGDAAIHPGAEDIIEDGIDQDCDGADATAHTALERESGVVLPDSSEMIDDGEGNVVHADLLFVVFDDDASEDVRAAAIDSVHAIECGRLADLGIWVNIPAAGSVSDLLDVVYLLEAHEGVSEVGLEVELSWEALPECSDLDICSMSAGTSWGYRTVRADEAWQLVDDLVASGAVVWDGNVEVAVIDNGFDTSHPDLADNMLTVLNSVHAMNLKEDTTDVSIDPELDGASHGTFVAGVACGVNGNGMLNGIAHDSGLFPVAIAGGSGRPSSFQFAAGIVHATSAQVEVINMSVGGAMIVDPLFGYIGRSVERAVAAAAERGIVVVASAGNSDGDADYNFPSRLEDVIAVGATVEDESTNARASYSNYASNAWSLTVGAPGDDIFGLYNQPEGALAERYGYMSGTSMAAPFVTGLVAVLRQAAGPYSPEDAGTLLRLTADVVPTDVGDWYRINAYRAVGYAVLGDLSPDDPLLFAPADGSPVSTDRPTLTWEGFDRDGDPLSYDVWIGPSEDDLSNIASELSEQTFEVAGLDVDSSWVWQVVARDPAGLEGWSKVWTFSVPPEEDLDRDEDGTTPAGGDCDDDDPARHPGIDETCNEIDDDCDGDVDEDATDAGSWYADGDGDGYGKPDDMVTACTAPSGTVPDGDDCDDTRSDIYTGADEVCDHDDNDCDGDVDEEAVDAPTWYTDADGDGYGDLSTGTAACDAPIDTVADAGDCDDTTDAANPDEEETCDGIDNDCDGEIDVGATDASTWYPDNDGDGFGDASGASEFCSAPSGYVTDASDCDDTTSAAAPGEDEVCDGIDNDCDGSVDVGASDMTTWYVDGDGDGYGDAAVSTEACTAPTGYVGDATDCDDGDATLYAGIDGDGDGYDCDVDCDESDTSVHPGAEDGACDGVDWDCNGHPDEGCWLIYGSEVSNPDRITDGTFDWTQPGYDDSAWSVVTLPDTTSTTDSYGHLYRFVVNVDRHHNTLLMDPTSDDGLWVYVNGTYVGHWGGEWGDGGCVNGSSIGCSGSTNVAPIDLSAYLIDGANVIAATVSNGACCGYYFDTDLDEYAAPAAALYGASSYAAAASSLSILGDNDGDGYQDLLVGAQSASVDGTAKGAAYVVRGPITASSSLADAAAVLEGEDTYDYAGISVAAAGDVDGDGTDDVLVGATHNDALAEDGGAVYLVLGPAEGVIALADADGIVQGESYRDYVGRAVSGNGDFDGDGLFDISLGASGHVTSTGTEGAVFVFSGGLSGTTTLSAADALLYGEDADDEIGYKHASDGDANGDGLADLLVGAYGNDAGGTSAGAAYLVYGPVSGTIALATADARLVGESASDYAGFAVAYAGDTDGDGFTDVLVGAYGDDDGGTSAGAAYLLLGPVSGEMDLDTADAKLTASTNDSAGRSVDGAGDFDGDGFDDIVVGAPYSDWIEEDNGRLWVVLGPLSGGVALRTAADLYYYGFNNNDELGWTLAGGADLDSDGYDDFVAGSLSYDGDYSNSGAVFFIPGYAP